MTHPSATVMPPNATTSFGPRFGPSTSAAQPRIGVSQVSSAMKMAKANWIAAIDQPCALLIGLTNSVQPYCRLAIRTMQRMTKISWLQRVAPSVAVAGAAVVTVDIFRPAFSNAAAALVRPGRSKRHAADGFCVTNSHRDRDYYEHTSFDATDVPVQVASQQPPEAQETMFRKGFSAPRTPPPAFVG